MKKELFLLAFIFVALILSYFLLFRSGDSPTTGNVLLDSKGNVENEGDMTNNNPTGSNEIDKDNSAESMSGASGSGGGSGTSPSEAGEDEDPASQIPMCMLVRPGNLPDIGCFISAITKEGVSINLKNELGEEIGVEIKLNSCQPEVKDTLNNNEIKNFVFTCEGVESYFNKEISIAYILEGNKRVEISGFISGPVS